MTIEQIGIIAGFGVLVGGVVLYLVRQRGTEGPPVGEVPRAFRSWVNAWYALNRWPIPFTRNGELIAVSERTRAR